MAHSDLARFSPDALIVWGGFEAKAYYLQREGWEFAVERGYTQHTERAHILMRHRQSDVCMYAEADASELFEHWQFGHPNSRGRALVIRVKHVVPDPKSMRFMTETRPNYARIDMKPEFAQWNTYDINDLGVFKPWSANKEELIVDTASVVSLMEQIKKLQDPQLAEIRKRNRLRESRGGGESNEQVVAQIIQIAA